MKNKKGYGKKRFTTRLLASLLAAVMTLTSVDVTAFATAGGTDTSSSYTVTEEAAEADDTNDSGDTTEESAAEAANDTGTENSGSTVNAADSGTGDSGEGDSAATDDSATEADETADAGPAADESGSASEESSEGTEETGSESGEAGDASDEAASEAESESGAADESNAGSGNDESGVSAVSEDSTEGDEAESSAGALTSASQTGETTSGYEGTTLKNYVDKLMVDYGLTVTVTQNPAGGSTIESGDAVTWYVTIVIPTAENYSGFTSYNKTLWDGYDDLTVTISAPEGITITYVSEEDSTVISSDGTMATVSLGYFAADSKTISFTVVGYVDADPAPETGTTYTLTSSDISYSAEVTVKDRDSSPVADVATYKVTGNAADPRDLTLTAKTDDKWALTKTQNSYSLSDDGSTLTVEYTIELIMNEFTQDTQYTANGRVNFAAFSIVDTPTLTGKDGTVYNASSVTAVNNITDDVVTGTTSITIDNYADLDDGVAGGNLKGETTATGVEIEGRVPFHTTYTVTVTYDAAQFTSPFYDVETFTMKNKAVLNYTLEYVDGTTPVTGTDTKTATGTYSYAADPATIDLKKYIQSIYGGGNYLTGTSLDSEYTGDVSFTILDGNGDAAALYVLVDRDSDGAKEYVQISNVITISRASSGAVFYVVYEDDSTGSKAEYNGLLYVNAGTYTIEETGNTVSNTSFTEFTADSNTALTTTDNKVYSFTLSAGQAATINAYNTETRGSISFDKSVTNYDGSSATGSLAGAVFGIYTDASCTIPVTASDDNAITATSDSQGTVSFTKLEPGTYYIKEVTALDGCLLDTAVYTATVTANSTTTTFSDGSGTVYNKKNTATLTFEKYLLSTDANGNLIQVAVDQDRLDNVFNNSSGTQVFVLQRSTDGTSWTTLTDKTFTLYRNTDSNNVTISSAVLSDLPVYTDSTGMTAYQYRIVEYLPSGYSLADIEGVTNGDISATEDNGTVTTDSFTLVSGDATVSLTNQTTGEISVYKQYVLANSDGATTNSASESNAVTVYLLTQNTDGSYSYVTTATNNGTTTESNGYATVTGVNILGSSGSTAQVYYWAEATSNSTYSSYELEGGQTIEVNVNGTPVKMYLLGTAAYASAYDSTSTKTTLTNILPYVRVKLTKTSSTTSSYVSGAGYTVYQVDANDDEVLYSDSLAQNTSGTVASGGSTLVLEAGYVYHIYETTVPDNYTGLTNANSYNASGEGYVTVDLKSAVPGESTDNGVLQGTYAVEASFIDEPYPTFKLTKNLVSVNGSSVSTSSYAASFTVYRSDTQDGTYTLYTEMSSYTANTTVYLEPGYYYAFVENVASDVISPEIYPGVNTTNSSLSGGMLTQIIIDDGTADGATAYAFVTSDVVTSSTSSTSYSISTVTNYEDTSSIKVTKYAYSSNSSSSITLDGAVIGLYSDASCEDQYLIKSGTTSGGTVTFTDLDIYTDDSGSAQKIYYIKEIDAPDGYYVDDTVYTVTLTPGVVSTVSIYDEQELSVSVPVIWENCLTEYQSSLEGATVYAYEVVRDSNGNITSYVLAGSGVSGSDGYATIGGLKHNTEYVFILGASGVTDTTASNYPLYASEDGSEDYLVTTTVTTDADGNTTVTYSDAPQTLTSLDSYQTISYTGCTDLSKDSDTITDSLVNHLLYLRIMIQKYCSTRDHGDDRLVGLYNSDGTTQTASGTWYVNGAQFTLYRQALDEDQIEALTNGETITISYDVSKLEKVTNDESTDTGKADVDDTYNTAYVYWLVETATGTAHTWANPDYYYRLLLYSNEWVGTIEAENATSTQKFTANETVYLNVENTCGIGTHEYLLTTIYMNKWAGYYDEFGVDTEDYSPLSGVTFSFSLKNSAGTVLALGSNTTAGDTALQYGETANGTDSTTGDPTTLTYLNNDAGQMNVMFKFPLMLNEWVVAVANKAGLSVKVTTITDITSESALLAEFNAITGDVWTTYADMLYVAGVIDASSMSQLTDLAANDGAIAKLILNGYANSYSTTTIILAQDNGYDAYVSAMENVLGSFYDYSWTDSNGTTYSLNYSSYYAHIVLTETSTTTSSLYGDYELNTTDYELYLQFRPTGAEGSANIKYFYLDNVDRTDYYYDADPSGVSTKVLDESFDNTTREQIVNMPVLKKSVTITKYGYTLNDSTVGKTDDELDTYFNTTDGTGRMKITASFYVQRYDSTTGEWKYYDTKNGVYVDETDRDSYIIEAKTDGWSGTLAIGWYRLIEVSAGSGYEVIINGTEVGISGSTDKTKAVRYFWVKTEKDSNAVNVYNPDSIDLLIHKYSLSDTEITSGVIITLTASDGTTKYKAEWNSSKAAWVISNLPAGTYTVTETVTNTSVTDDYFQSFTITVGYDRVATAEDVTLTYSKTTSTVTQYATSVTGVSATISGQVDCVNDSTKDSITANAIDSSGATATLKIYNPSTGSITITKTDANNSSTKLQNAKFKLYYQKFTVSSTDAYVADTSSTPTYTSESSDWTYINTYTTGSDGTVTASGLTPGWYAIVETSAPDGYELNSEVQVVAVVADMVLVNGVHTKTDGGNVSVIVSDVKKVNLSVTKIFNLNGFSTDLQDEAQRYSVTFGLYVYDTASDSYISAYSLGLTDTDTVTVKVTNTSGTISTETGTWYNLIQMEEYLDSDNHYVLTTSDGTTETTYSLDGYYYIREISVKNTNTSADITSNWWVSNVTMSSGSSLTVASTAVTDSSGCSYYQISGFKDNKTGTVTVTDDLSYATVEILKTDDSSPAQALSGAVFTVYSDVACTTEVATGKTGTNGTCTITVPVSSTTVTTFYIKETTAPTGYTLNEDTITVTLTSGQKVSYNSDSSLTVKDSNGVYVKLTKYDNIHGCSNLNTLSNVTFTLLRSTDSGTTWTVLRTYTTDSAGGINFDTLKNSSGTIYMLAETTYDTDAYDGLESVWYTVTAGDGSVTKGETKLTEDTVTVTVGGTDVSYTGYQFSLEGIASGSTYQIYAYNQPKPAVTFIKKGDGSGSATPLATLQIYSVDSSKYTAGQTLTNDEVTAAISAGTWVDTIITSVVSGKDYSSATEYLSAGTYLVVETATSDSNNEYVINKDDAEEVWYQIIVVPADGTKEMTVTFVNVTQEYSVSISKSGTTALNNDLLSYEADLSYSLDVDVTNSGPISGFTVTDSGLTVTKIYDGVGSSATTSEVSASDADKYLDGDYSITSVKIPVDASYTVDSLVFTSGDKSDFTQSVTAKVIFTYEDGTTEEQIAPVLANVTTMDGYWTVTPKYSSLKAVSFTVTWYDETLETYTGYELGSDFTISDSNLDILVEMHIDEQEGGTTSYYAVAEIKNSADVTYNYSSWDTTGTATGLPATDDAEALTTVPNVSAAQMTITKTVENETSSTRNTNKTANIGDTLLYTITLTNSSSSLSMDNPVILDLLPQGVVAASAADENSFIANVTIVSSTNANSTLAITNVWRTRSDGYTLLEIVTSGSIAPGETVTITLEAVVDSTILNYLTASASLTNNVWMTSSEQGTVYHDNAIGSVFMGNTGSWAGNYTDPTSSNIMAGLLSDLGFTGYGYISDAASVTYQTTSSVTLLKEVQGDQDVAADSWYHGDEGGTVTANTTNGTDDDGYANFRLTVTNMTDSQDLTNIVLMDIIPKEGGASYNTNIDKEWSLVFDSITSVTVDGAALNASQYTVWYYTGSVITDAEVAAMQSAFNTRETDTNSSWVKATEFEADTSNVKSNITAFAVVFDSSVSLATGHQLQLIYKATVPQMTDDEASNKAHLATYNDFNVTGDMVASGTGTTVSSVSLTSNYVFALLSTEPVGVGGMFWIDADGDGMQDSEDVTPDTYDKSTDAGGTEESTASTYNSRKNYYADYSVVQTLLNTASIQLLTYNGSTNSQVTTYSERLLTSGSWRFLFTDLVSANISSKYTGNKYDGSGIVWSALAGASTASWYKLQATIAGNESIKYSLTNSTSDVTSYDPDVMYSANNSSVGDALKDSNFDASGSGTITTSNTITGSAITTGSTTAVSENFFLYGTTSGNALWNLAEDIGVVIYRDLQITKNDTDGSSPKSGSTFEVYGPYAAGEAEKVKSLDNEHLVGTYTTIDTNTTTLLVEDLLYFQEYIIVEVSADDSYDLNSAAATGTNITAMSSGVTKTISGTVTTYKSAWILNIPSSTTESSTDPAYNNALTTDSMTVTNAVKMGFSLTKIDGDGISSSYTDADLTAATTLSNATFAIYAEDDVTVTTNASDKVTSVTVKSGTTALGTATSDSSGTATFYDTNNEAKFLDSGTYYVIETVAPSGYVLLKQNYWKVTVNTAEQTIIIEESDSGSVFTIRTTDSSTGKTSYSYYIPNYTEYTLPATGSGGVPMLWITLFGCMLIFMAAGLWMLRKRSRAA